MLLALDIGNSRIKWGLYQGLDCQAVGFFPTRDFLPPDAYDYEFEPLDADATAQTAGGLTESSTPWPTPIQPHWLGAVTAIALSSVGGNSAETRLLAHFRALGLADLPVWRVRASAEALGVRNGYADPARLGSDRWAALVAGRTHRRGPMVIVMAGTATTVDALDGQGQFLGGYILPGMRLMPKSLYERTAGIQPGEGAWQEYPDRTSNAVASGVLAATAGAVAGMVHSLQLRSPTMAVHTLVSGGNGPVLLPRMRALGLAPDYQRDLVLEGVCRLYLADGQRSAG